MLRLALGYSYREIARDEGVSLTTTNKQIVRAKRLLRALDSDEGSSEAAGSAAGATAAAPGRRALAA